jgi:predicted NBD/HSP70 family sugar kinase
MPISIGVLLTRSIWVGVVDGIELGAVQMFPEPGHHRVDLKSLRPDEMIHEIRRMVGTVREGADVDCVGAGFPGIVRHGVIEDSPNLGPLKGLQIADQLARALAEDGVTAPVTVLNDADALAAGIAATSGALENVIRVWYLGDGIGFGRYPRGEGISEAGHTVVTLDPKERFCGCGGRGHLEGICGTRAIRLRFLDREPEEVFAAAHQGDTRAADFVRYWHRALAAATATSVHLDGPGRFYLAGPNAEFVDTNCLHSDLQEMVVMSPLQGSYFEVVPTSQDLALIGAAVCARTPWFTGAAQRGSGT